MSGSRTQRFTLWLALIAALWMGVAPGQGLILCFEPDGSVALELAGANRPCDPCAGSEAENAEARLVSEAPRCCECLDIPVEGLGDAARVAPTPLEEHAAPCVAAPEPWTLPVLTFVERGPIRCGDPPGLVGILAQLRTVELRV